MHSRRALWLSCVLFAGIAGAQLRPVMPAVSSTARTVSVAEYRSHLVHLREIVAACASAAAVCDPSSIGPDDRIVQQASSGFAFQVRYEWLRTALDDKTDPKREHRAANLATADIRLQEQVAELDNRPVPASVSQVQRKERDRVLARGEFREVQGYSLSDQLSARFQRWLSHLFSGLDRVGRAAPWLGTALQWGTLALAASVLLLWIFRALDRQRVALGRLGAGGFVASAAAEESRSWAAQARTFAEQGAWRDAVHCLYWASIVALEDRKLFRSNRTRTPREHLQLLGSESRFRAPLAEQTRDFERIWYGLREAVARDYERALESYQALQPERSRAERTADA